MPKTVKIISLRFNGHFTRWTWISWYQKSQFWIDSTGANDDGGGGNNWTYKTCKAPDKSSPLTNQHPAFLQAGRPSCHPTNSVKALKGTKTV